MKDSDSETLFTRVQWTKICLRTKKEKLFSDSLERECKTLRSGTLSSHGIYLSCMGRDKSKRVDEFPLYFYKGGKILEEEKVAAVTGTRRPTAAGKTVAAQTARILAGLGYRIVSDLSSGISSCVQTQMLDLGFPGIAVIPSQAGKVYPSYREDLAEKITHSGGTVVWLLPPMKNARIYPSDFALANTFIASLSDFVVFIEGTLRSGTKSLIEYAAENGREVMVWKSAVKTPQSQMSEYLIESGCKYFESPEQLLPNEYSTHREKSSINLTRDEIMILDCALEETPLSLLVEKSAIPASKALSLITCLELRGFLEKTPDGNIKRTEFR
ncbi:DNA-processing protein DprA [candidate division WOR-3 bacterium]|nr:DNA-processing protein DprA [candidate division WOR-3 bacterium]